MADPPLINPQWLTSPTDQAVAVAGYKRVRQLFNTAAMQPVLLGSEYFPGSNVSLYPFYLFPLLSVKTERDRRIEILAIDCNTNTRRTN